MSFITQGKTNWKFLLIVVVLAVIVGGVIWLLSTLIPEQVSVSEESAILEEETTEEIEEETVNSEVFGYLSVGCGQECGDCCYVYTYRSIENDKFTDLERITIQVSKEILNECIYLKGYEDKKIVSLRDVEIIKNCTGEKETESDKFDKMIADFFCDDFIVPEWGKLIGVTYLSQEIDLNNDGVNEIIVGGEGCSYEKKDYFIVSISANYPHIILQKMEGSWIKIGNFTGRSPLIKKEKTNGYYDIEVEIKMGFESYVIELYQWQEAKSEYELKEYRESLL